MLPRLWGRGKFESVDAASLAYIRGLGADYVWYTGIIRHATRKRDEGCRPSHPQIVKGEAGSPYAITDYYDVNPYLATNPDARMEDLYSNSRFCNFSDSRELVFYKDFCSFNTINFASVPDNVVIQLCFNFRVHSLASSRFSFRIPSPLSREG